MCVCVCVCVCVSVVGCVLGALSLDYVVIAVVV